MTGEREASCGRGRREHGENLHDDGGSRAGSVLDGKSAEHSLAQALPWGIDRIDADRLHDEGTTGDGATVAVVATGIDPDHPDLPTPVDGKDFTGTGSWNDDNGFGTHVAGIIAAKGNNEGVVGVGPDLDLLAVKVLDSDGSGTLSDAAAGIEWAVFAGADVICIALSQSSGSSTLKDACQEAADNGIVLVSAAGNDFGASVNYPAVYDTVIGVSAINKDDNLASYSNYGPEVDLTAPGNDIYSTDNTGGYTTISGTELAAAHVAGVAAVVLAETGLSDRSSVRDRLKSTAEDIGLGGNEQGSGLVDATNAVPLYGEHWQFDVGSRLQYATPAANGSRVFVGSLDATVYALDRDDGTVDWSFERDGALADSAPALSGGRVYVGGGGGTLYAFDADADSATVDWTFTTGSALVSSPVVDGDTVYVASNDGRVFALDDTASGDELWHEDVGGAVYSSPSVGASSVAVTTDDGAVSVIDVDSGDEVHRYETGRSNLGHTSPLLANDLVYLAAEEVYALNPNGGDLRVEWSTPYGGPVGSSPVYDPGTEQLFVGSADGNLYAFDASSGDEQWRYDTGGPVGATPAVVGDWVLIANDAGDVTVLDAADGSEVASRSIGHARAGPTVDGDIAFVGTRDGLVFALANAPP